MGSEDPCFDDGNLHQFYNQLKKEVLLLHDMASKLVHVSRLLTITIEICESGKNKLLDHTKDREQMLW